MLVDIIIILKRYISGTSLPIEAYMHYNMYMEP